MKKRVDFVAEVDGGQGSVEFHCLESCDMDIKLHDRDNSNPDYPYWIPITQDGLAFLEAVVEAMKTLLKEGK
jgi:hypothetical protein